MRPILPAIFLATLATTQAQQIAPASLAAVAPVVSCTEPAAAVGAKVAIGEAVEAADYMPDWVEEGSAPETIATAQMPPAPGRGVSLPPSTAPIRTRPVYPYPLVATYNWSGDPNLAASFTARPGPPIAAEQLQWLGSSNYTPAEKR